MAGGLTSLKVIAQTWNEVRRGANAEETLFQLLYNNLGVRQRAIYDFIHTHPRCLFTDLPINPKDHSDSIKVGQILDTLKKFGLIDYVINSDDKNEYEVTR